MTWKDVLRYLTTPAPATAGAGAVAASIKGKGIVQDAVTTVTSVGDATGKAVGNLTNTQFWERVGVGMLGTQMIVAGIVIVLASTRAVRETITTVASRGVVK